LFEKATSTEMFRRESGKLNPIPNNKPSYFVIFYENGNPGMSCNYSGSFITW